MLTGLSQIFIVPAGAKTLQFTIAAAAFRANGSLSPPDAFEVALLRDGTLAPLIGPAAGLTHTDAFLNVQPNGQVFFGPGVTVSGLSASGQTAALSVPLTVTVDLRTVAAGTRATLYFDLLGFGPDTSSVVVRDVSILVDPPTGGGSGTPGGGTGGGGGGGGNTGGGTGSGTGGSTGGTGSSPGETGGSPGGSGSPGSGTGGADGQGAGGGLGSIVTPGGSAPGGGSGSARQEPRLSDGGLDHGRGTAGEPAPAGLGGDASGTVSGLTIVVSSPAVVSSGPAAATPTARGSAALPEGQGFQAFVDAATQTPTTARRPRAKGRLRAWPRAALRRHAGSPESLRRPAMTSGRGCPPQRVGQTRGPWARTTGTASGRGSNRLRRPPRTALHRQAGRSGGAGRGCQLGSRSQRRSKNWYCALARVTTVRTFSSRLIRSSPTARPARMTRSCRGSACSRARTASR